MDKKFNTGNSEDLLKSLYDSGIIKDKDLLIHEKMITEKFLEEHHPYKIQQTTDGRFQTNVRDSSKKEGRRKIVKPTMELLKKTLAEHYKGETLNLENLFTEWAYWKFKKRNRASSTIVNYKSDWQKYFANDPIIKIPIVKITLKDLIKHALRITENKAITKNHLIKAVTILNGIFEYAIMEKEILDRNIMNDMSYRKFYEECREADTEKQPYTDDEITRIQRKLEQDDDVRSLALQFLFRNLNRIGEHTAIYKSDIIGDKVRIDKMQIRHNEINEDLSTGSVEYKIVPRTKGGKKSGKGNIDITPKAKEVALKAIKLYPETEFLFPYKRKAIIPKTLNRYIKKVCTDLEIEYRPSHQIRFTNATRLKSNGLTVSEISPLMRHATEKQTEHYIREKITSDNTKQILVQTYDR